MGLYYSSDVIKSIGNVTKFHNRCAPQPQIVFRNNCILSQIIFLMWKS